MLHLTHILVRGGFKVAEETEVPDVVDGDIAPLRNGIRYLDSLMELGAAAGVHALVGAAAKVAGRDGAVISQGECNVCIGEDEPVWQTACGKSYCFDCIVQTEKGRVSPFNAICCDTADHGFVTIGDLEALAKLYPKNAAEHSQAIPREVIAERMLHRIGVTKCGEQECNGITVPRVWQARQCTS